ncbi:juvenile hormone acid O-methyltransferase-like [Rhipicephalus sanguineus]|uniref:juvenile hormone acid O-methyltransferase-like n=1 Tax=Rhipicephalus sanguineus TaxID=34632 RepID=UPI0018941A42|nr:juvenile hormone acid O-methyltransferase-like [Rhipicephalus sanguineus]
MALNSMEENKLDAVPFRSVLAPEMYAERNAHTCDLSLDLFQVYKMAFRTPSDESQQFLDIGCGPGDFMRNWILPSCEPCKRIVAVDSSISMIEYAKKNYAHEKILYEHLDIDNDVSAFSKKHGAFQRVYSFKTLHWSRDLHRCLGNIAQLLSRGGECLLYFHARSFLFESFKELSHLEPWTKYADVLLRAVPKSHNIVNRRSLQDYLYSALSSAGLVPYTAEVLVSQQCVQSKNPGTDGLYQIGNPLFSLLDDEERPAFVDALSRHLNEWHDLYCRSGGQNVFSAFLVHAVKPEE